MMKITAYSFFLFFLVAGCRKEKSLEAGNTVFIGNNCRISQILTVDSATSTGLVAHNAFFDATGKAIGTELYDSLSYSLYFASSITHSGDTAFVNAQQYFIQDAATGRVKEFKGLLDPSDPLSDTVRITFSYNSAGYLTKKEYFFYSLPDPLLRSTYTYTNGNLTKALLENVFPATELIVYATAEYNTAQAINGGMYVFPDGFFTLPYNLSFNFGQRPSNTLKKVTTKIYNAGVITDSLVTNYKNYKLSGDHYVLELFAEGDYQDGIGIVDGLTKFSYKCK